MQRRVKSNSEAEEKTGYKMPYEVLKSYRRFDQKYNMIMRCYWDESLKDMLSWRRMTETRMKRMEQNLPGYTLVDWALYAASSACASMRTRVNTPNSGLLSWVELEEDSGRRSPESFPEPLPPKPTERLKIDDLGVMSVKIKKVAKFLGADLVGIAELDRRWIYSNHYITNTGESIPVEIPEDFKYVIAMGKEMRYAMINTAPAVTSLAEVELTYSKMALLVSSLARFIRSLGYGAIPSLNDTALNVPIAIDAGLGQVGRHGLLINPNFDPMRLCKVITNLPMKIDKPIDFGITEFCGKCTECARQCPGGAIPFGEHTFEGPTISNNPGVLKWHLNAEKCRKYCIAGPGTNCGICMKVCPLYMSAPFYLRYSSIGRSNISGPLLRPSSDELEGASSNCHAVR